MLTSWVFTKRTNQMVTEDFQVCPLMQYWGCSPCVFLRTCFSKKTLCTGGSLCNRWRYQSSEHRVSTDFPLGHFLLLGRVSIIPGKFPPLLLFSLCLRRRFFKYSKPLSHNHSGLLWHPLSRAELFPVRTWQTQDFDLQSTVGGRE